MRRNAALLAVGLLSSCATYQPHPLAPAQWQASYEARTLADPALRDFIARSSPRSVQHWPVRRWNLETLVLAAFYYSPQLDVARKQWAARSAATITAAQRPNPALLLPFAYAVNPAGGKSPYTLGLGLDIPIETAGKRGYRIKRAEALANAARFDAGNAAWQVRTRVRAQLLGLYAASRRASIFESRIGVQQEIAALLDTRAALGAASSPEVDQAHIALTQNRVDLAAARQQLYDARARLAGLIGVPRDALTNIDFDFAAFERRPTALPDVEAQRRSLLNRADLLSALAHYRASEAALQLEVARQYPDVRLRAGYTFDMGTNKYALSGAGITLPIFNRNEGPIAEAKARRDVIAARVNALQARAINETGRSLADYEAALNKVSLADALVAAQRTRLQRLRRTFEAGQTDRLALALATRLLYVDELAHLDAGVEVQQALGALEDAMQLPFADVSSPSPDSGTERRPSP